MNTQTASAVLSDNNQIEFDVIGSALSSVACEMEGLHELEKSLTGPLKEPFEQAVNIILSIKGRLIVTGMGKSGHIARKLAATLASTGTPAFFVHPAEASHGDLGMIRTVDAVLALSWSGETAELANIVSYTRRFNVPLIALTSRNESALSQQSDVSLCLPLAKEACPNGLAPTTSTTIQLCLGDALAVALLESKGFSAMDFKTYHPGGSLGTSLQYVRDLMYRGEKMPLVKASTPMSEVIVEMSKKSFGCVGVVDESGVLIGMITDGDLRRHLDNNLMRQPAEVIMTENPRTLSSGILVPAAIEVLNSASISSIFVVEDDRPMGIIHMHDLLRIGAA